MTANSSIQKFGLTDISQSDFNQLYTYEEYYSWKFPERIELIDGVPYHLFPTPRTIHQYKSGLLFYKWYGFFEGKSCEVFAAPIDVYFSNSNGEKTNTVVQPDICIVCDAAKIEEKGINGAPDLIIEILSPKSKRDTHDKFNLYEREGVKEYWIVHPQDAWLVIYALNDDDKYVGSKHYTQEDGKINSVLFPDFKLDLKKLFEKETNEAENKK